MREKCISVKNVTKYFHGRKVVDNLSFHVFYWLVGGGSLSYHKEHECCNNYFNKIIPLGIK